MSPGRNVGTRNCSTQARNSSPLIGPSKTQGATIPSVRRPAMNVIVVQRECGAAATRRLPHPAQPWVRVIFVFAQVSSMNISRLAATNP